MADRIKWFPKMKNEEDSDSVLIVFKTFIYILLTSSKITVAVE